uniref:Polyprotein allergen nematode domain-containing protein n=1 Tax=Strongyloides stercoralis TaxID=6248 RepID=A0A913HU74_STRER
MIKDKMLIVFLLIFIITISNISGGPLSNKERHSRYRRSGEANYDAWMTDEQILDIGNMKSSGKSDTEVKEKIMTYFNKLTDEQKKPWNQYYKKMCIKWIKDVCSDEEQKEFKTFLESKNVEKMEEKLAEYANRLSDSKKGMVLAWKKECQDLLTDDSIEIKEVKRRDTHHTSGKELEETHNLNEDHSNHNHDHGDHHGHHHKRHIKGDWDSFKTEHLSWLTEDQQSEINEMKQNGASKESISNKILFFFNKVSENKREEAAETLKTACKELYTNIFGEKKVNNLKELKDSGATFEELESKFEEYMGEITDENKIDELKSYNVACKKLFQEYRKKREIHQHSDFESFAKEHLSWLNEEQLKNIKTMKNDGSEKSEIVKTIIGYFDEIDNEEKKSMALDSLKSACREVLINIFGEEKAREIKAMKEKGASHEEIAETVNGWRNDIKDPEKIEKLNTYSSTCTMLFKKKLSKRHIHGQFESFISEHLGFLNDNQKNELRQMKIDGVSRQDIAKKIFGFYQETFGERKKEAFEKLTGLCAEIIGDVFGKDTLINLREMRDSGMTYFELEKIVQEKINQLTDEKKIEKVKAYVPICRGIYKAISLKRFKKNSSVNSCPDMKEIIRNSNSWLNEKDKIIINDLQDKDFHSSRMGIKYILAFSKAVGEQKIKATKLLRAQCDQLLKNEVGEKAFNELNDMIESNKSSDDIAVKFLDLVYLSKNENSCTWGNVVMLCRQTYISVSNLMKEGISTRKKRHPHTDFDEFAKHHLTWLTSDQLNEIKKMIEDGIDKKNVGEKIMDFYDLLEGESKHKASEELNLACSEIFEEIFGLEAKNVVTEMKSSGKSIEEIGLKVSEYESKLDDEEKKLKFAAMKPSCKRLAMVKHMQARRKRHDDDEDMNSFINDHLKWLTSDQLETIKSMMSDKSKRAELSNKVMEFYNEATGDAKTEATNQLAGACREFFRKVIGNEAADEMQKLKESGATFEEMEKKGNEFVATITNEADKEKMKMYGPNCKIIFKALARKKRHMHGDYNSFANEHLDWLTENQLKEIDDLKKDGKCIQHQTEKIEEFFDSADEATKVQAKKSISSVCREVYSQLLSDDVINEIKKMKEDKASFEEIETKYEEHIKNMKDKDKKFAAEAYSSICKKAFKYGNDGKSKRHIEGDFESFISEHLSWMSKENLDKIKSLKESGKSDSEIGKEVYDIYKSLSGEDKNKATIALSAVCKEFFSRSLGPEATAQLLKLHEDGASLESISSKLSEFESAITDDIVKKKLERYKPSCKELYIEHKKIVS